MKLLICTQAVDLDDPVLGFFHRWIEEFARHCGRVHVICLQEGRHALPGNVRVHSLGKEGGRSRVKYVFRFYRYLWTWRRDYDAVFVHMNPEYLVLGGLLWRAWGRPIGLWYVHRSAGLLLRAGAAFADVVFSATPESLRLATRKARFIGHGIDTGAFSCPPLRRARAGRRRVIAVGRLSPIKRLEVLVDAARLLRSRGVRDFEIALIGGPVYESDRAYAADLERRAAAAGLGGVVRFEGAAAFSDMPRLYCDAIASVNLAPTGGSDKAVLESLASGAPAFVCNRAFAELYGEYAGAFIFKENDPADLAAKIERFLGAGDAAAAGDLAKRVRERFSLEALVRAIMRELEPISKITAL